MIDYSGLAVFAPIVASLCGGVATVAVALISSRKTRADVHDELSVAKIALREEIEEMKVLLAECRAQHADSREEVFRQGRLIVSLQKNLANIRTGKPTDWGELGPPELLK